MFESPTPSPRTRTGDLVEYFAAVLVGDLAGGLVGDEEDKVRLL